MKNNKYYKIFAIILFPFLRALLIGSTLSLYAPVIFMDIFGVSYNALIPIWINDIRPNELNFIIIGMINALFGWGLFYLSIMTIFEEGERLKRFYEFTTPLKLTALFSIVFFIVINAQYLNLTGPYFGYAVLLRFLFWFFLLLLVPIIVMELIWLGILIKRTKNYTWFKSQCFSFAIFLLLPLVITSLAHWLFTMIFMTKH